MLPDGTLTVVFIKSSQTILNYAASFSYDVSPSLSIQFTVTIIDKQNIHILIIKC